MKVNRKRLLKIENDFAVNTELNLARLSFTSSSYCVATNCNHLIAKSNILKKNIISEDMVPDYICEEGYEILKKISSRIKYNVRSLMNGDNENAKRKLLQIACECRSDSTGIFLNQGLFLLKKWGVINDFNDFDGKIGDRLLDLVRKSKGTFGDVLLFVVSNLVKENGKDKNGIISLADLKSVFEDDDNWLDELAKASALMPENQRYKVLNLSLRNILKRNILNKNNLIDAFKIEKGRLLYELIISSKKVVMCSNFFNNILNDWLEENNEGELSLQDVVDFISETSDAANVFYKARQKYYYRKFCFKNNDDECEIPFEKADESQIEVDSIWSKIMSNYSDIIFPTNDLPRILRGLANVLEDPLNKELAVCLGLDKKVDILYPKNERDLKFLNKYVNFIEYITQKAGLKRKWLDANVELSDLTRSYKNKTFREKFEIAVLLNSTSKQLGDKWLKVVCKGNFPSWGDSFLVVIDLSNIEDTYAKYHILKVVDRESLDAYYFQLKISNVLNINSISFNTYSHLFLYYDWLVEMVGKDKVDKVLNGTINNIGGDLGQVKLNLNRLPKELFSIVELEKIRTNLNEKAKMLKKKNDVVTYYGDVFIDRLFESLGMAIIVSDDSVHLRNNGGDYISIRSMIEILYGWSDKKTSKSLNVSRDIKKIYERMIEIIAEQICDYFSANLAEYNNYFKDKVGEKNIFENKMKELGIQMNFTKGNNHLDEIRRFLNKE